MAGERDLKALLRDMRAEMREGIFVFCTIVNGDDIPAAIRPLLTFHEQEGMTLVLRREEAERAGLRYQFASRLITLTVHSSLDAVGLSRRDHGATGRGRHQPECGFGVLPRSSVRAGAQGR